MSSTLLVRRTPKAPEEWAFKMPVKSAIARRYYEHDGSLGGEMITLTATELPWFEGLLAGSSFDAEDTKSLKAIVQVLRDGDDIDLWFEV